MSKRRKVIAKVMKEKERGSTCICIQSLFAWINNIRTLGTPLSLLIDILKKFLANKPQDLESLVIQVDEPVTLRPALPLDARRKILVASRPRTHTHTHTHTRRQPMQRVTRYPMLMERLEECTDPQNRDAGNIKNAIIEVKLACIILCML